MEPWSIPLVILQSHNAYFIEYNGSCPFTDAPQIKALFWNLKVLQSRVHNKEKNKTEKCQLFSWSKKNDVQSTVNLSDKSLLIK